MAYASRAGRAHASITRPRAFAVCDRCGIWYNHNKLRWQFDFAGVGLVNKRLLVCGLCLDTPQHQLRAIILPADPIPILNPRLEMYRDDESPLRLTNVGPPVLDRRTGLSIPDGAVRTTLNGERRVTQQTGAPVGSLNEQPGTDPNAPGEPGLPPHNEDVPETGPL